MLQHHIHNLEENIFEYKKSIENDTLNLQYDTLNDTLILSLKEKNIFDIIMADNYILISEIMERTGYSRPTVTRAISKLKEKQILDRAGAKKNGHWVIKK